MAEEGNKRPAWKIWLYLTPLYVVIAIPLLLWIKKVNSGDLRMSKDEYSAFNSDQGTVKKYSDAGYNPELMDGSEFVRYREQGAALGSLPGDNAPKAEIARVQREAEARGQASYGGAGAAGGGDARSASQRALESGDTRDKEQMAAGYKAGYLSYAVSKILGSPGAVHALLSNKYVIDGFMARGSVKAATGSAQGLANYLKGPGPSNFINNPIVKEALNNPAVVSAVASSGIVQALMNTPAAQQLMADPQALGDLVNNNPQLMQLAMQNPQTLSTLMSNPQVSGLVGKFDTSKIKTY